VKVAINWCEKRRSGEFDKTMFKLSNPECGPGGILENPETNATLVCPAFVTASWRQSFAQSDPQALAAARVGRRDVVRLRSGSLARSPMRMKDWPRPRACLPYRFPIAGLAPRWQRKLASSGALTPSDSRNTIDLSRARKDNATTARRCLRSCADSSGQAACTVSGALIAHR
jgi:hypothetical protein